MSDTGHRYRDLVAAYIEHNFAARGVEVYTEVSLGKSIIAKDRRVDVLVIGTNAAFVVECKTQAVKGSADEKLFYALQDLQALRIPAVIAYAGDGFSAGVVQMLQAHPAAVFCSPDAATLARDSNTDELDVQLAQAFGWFDLLRAPGRRFNLDSWRRETKGEQAEQSGQFNLFDTVNAAH